MGKTIRKLWVAGAASIAGGIMVATPLVSMTATAAHAAAPESRTLAPELVTLPPALEAETQMLDLLNGYRFSNGMTPLVRVPTLDQAARDWSQFMTDGGCIDRDGASLCHRRDLALIASFAAPKGWSRAGENVGSVPDGGTIQSLHNAFVGSSAHRANMLNPEYNAVGVGVEYKADGTLFVTFEFVATVGAPNSTGPVLGFPDAPEGASQEDSFVFYVNYLREKAGLQPLVRQAVLDREAAWWSGERANGACGVGIDMCNRRDSTAMVKAAVGSGKTRWWGGAAGATVASDVSAQVAWFASSAPMRALLMRTEANLIGIGYARNDEGMNYITLTVLQAKTPNATLPANATHDCGWVQTTLKVRAKGVAVRVAQCALTAAGVWTGPIDGKYTTDMAKAIKVFQKAHKLKANGMLDPKTRKALWLT